ncbi:hypothetical protein CLOSTASPAR_06399 [[Clostridium] asparagiforme DSM 15981]|uniref:Uncharacterized protein n=1 Tax=[Clostridium] asparagiforme DSM 15981 TaxID=518636 RepID=C0DAU5_9FIRM|nr:hypothetical protein CLOSTASPAR_06399 [[Clostridium] asparagiforme DSM 15981]
MVKPLVQPCHQVADVYCHVSVPPRSDSEIIIESPLIFRNGSRFSNL